MRRDEGGSISPPRGVTVACILDVDGSMRLT
jgi:hypothetical protein